jgi:hypothetical protein
MTETVDTEASDTRLPNSAASDPGASEAETADRTTSEAETSDRTASEAETTDRTASQAETTDRTTSETETTDRTTSETKPGHTTSETEPDRTTSEAEPDRTTSKAEAEPDTTAPENEASVPREHAAEEPQPDSLRAQLEQLSRELGVFARAALQLEAARNMPEVRRAVRQVAGLLVVVVALVAAFAFLNVAAVEGLSKAMAPWLAALVLAIAWIAIGGVLLFGYLHRARRWLVWLLFKAPPPAALEELERQRNEAGEAMRVTLERVGPAVAIEIATAAIPDAGDVASEVAGGFIGAGDSVIEVSDEIVEVIAGEIPGGGVVAQAWDVVLIPGRFGVRVATTVLRRVRPAR